MEPRVFSVAQINSYIKQVLEQDFVLEDLFLRGEISNFKAHSSGHCYFTLKDSSCAISCIMFRQFAQNLLFSIENGMDVVAYGHVSVYEKTGQYQFHISDMEPIGLGTRQAIFEQRKQKLLQEGLFDSEFKRELPQYPHCIAVVTSPTGAAVRDIINVIQRRDKSIKIVVVPTLVQGEQAAEDIVCAIRLVNEWKQADVMILGRGGGSMEDLWCFNEECVARAIFASEIPVISAIGHETDFTIADFVSDLRAPTPSAAAELATKACLELQETVTHISSRLQKAMQFLYTDYERRFWYLCQNNTFKQPLQKFLQKQQFVEQSTQLLTRNLQQYYQNKEKHLSHLLHRLEAVSPYAILARGYVVAQQETGEIISSVHQVTPEQQLQLHLKDGTLLVEVKEKVVHCYGKEKSDI